MCKGAVSNNNNKNNHKETICEWWSIQNFYTAKIGASPNTKPVSC